MARPTKASQLNVVDSSAWLSYFANDENADNFAAAIQDTQHLIVPAIVLFEVFKKALRERGEQAALQIAGAMCAGKVVPIDAALALDTARYSMPMADSLIYATAQRLGALVWTQDEDFVELANVRYFAKPNVKALAAKKKRK